MDTNATNDERDFIIDGIDLSNIKIMGLNWKIKVNRFDDNRFGNCNYKRQTISLADNTSLELQISTLVHEILHIIYWSVGLDKFNNTELSEEKIVNSLSMGLYEVMTNNPSLLLYLMAKQNSKNGAV